MAITPGPGYQVDPTNPNKVIPIQGTSTAQAQGLGVYSTPAPKPMGITATNPAQNITGPNTSLPSSQQNTISYNTPQPQKPLVAEPTSSSLTGTQQSGAPSYAGLIGQLLQNAFVGSPIAGQAAQGLIGTAQNNPLEQGQLAQNYKSAIDAQNALKQGIAQQYTGVETSGIPLGYQQGREAAMARQYASQLDAAQQAVNQAQAGLGYGIQEQGQQQAGYNQAGNLGLAGQTLLQNALTSAAQGAAPSGSYPFVFNPLTGGYTQSTGIPGTAGGITSPQQAAQGVLNGQLTYDQAKQALSFMGGTGEAQLQSAILAQNPQANIAALQAQGVAQQSNVQSGVTAPVQANQAIYGKALNDYYSLQNSVQNVDQFGGLLTQTMQQGGINPSDVKYANQTLSQIRGQLSSAQQAVYDNTLATLRSRVSGLLAIGGSEIPTQITADATKILDGTLPLQSLNAVLGRIQQEGTILLNNQANLVNQARSGTLGDQGNSSPSGAITWESL